MQAPPLSCPLGAVDVQTGRPQIRRDPMHRRPVAGSSAGGTAGRASFSTRRSGATAGSTTLTPEPHELMPIAPPLEGVLPACEAGTAV